jgi:hypothetical protein
MPPRMCDAASWRSLPSRCRWPSCALLGVWLTGHAFAQTDGGSDAATAGGLLDRRSTAPEPTAVLKGVVRSMGTRRPLAVATVEPDRGDSTETDTGGAFELVLPAGHRCLQVRAGGFIEHEMCEELKPGEVLVVVYALQPRYDVDPYETVVRGERDRTEVSRTSLSARELEQVPGTAGDPLRAIMLLPGVGTVYSGVAQPVVRGSQPSGTGYFLDGVQIPLLFHLFVGPSVVHPEFISGLDFYPGAPPAQYGRLLGGAVDVKTQEPRHDGVHASVSLDLMNVGGFADLPIERTGTDVTLAGRFSFAPWLLALTANATRAAGLVSGDSNSQLALTFYDYQARVEQKVGAGQLRLFVFGSSDDYGVGPVDATQGWLVRAGFHRADLRYRVPIGRGELEAGVTLGLDILGYFGPNPSGYESVPGVGLVTVTTFAENVTEPSLRGRLSWKGQVVDGLEARVGADVDRQQANLSFEQKLSLEGGPSLTRDQALPASLGTLFGAWALLVWTPSPRWQVSPGIRVDSYHLFPGIERVAVEPRLSARCELPASVTLKAAVGLFHQPPAALINLPIADMGGLKYGLQEGLQIDVGAEWKPRRWLELVVDAYFNPLFRTVDLSVFGSGALGFMIHAPQGGDPFPGVSPTYAHGYATGLEVMLRKPLGDHWFGWLSYSLQRSVRSTQYQVVDPVSGMGTGISTADLPSSFDQTHVLNAMVSYAFPRGFTAGINVHFNTGRPESGNQTSWTELPGLDVNGRPAWHAADAAHVARLPPFFRLDFRISKQFVFRDFLLDVFLDVLNTTLSTEVVRYGYSVDVNGALVRTPTGLPVIIPMLGVKSTY